MADQRDDRRPGQHAPGRHAPGRRQLGGLSSTGPSFGGWPSSAVSVTVRERHRRRTAGRRILGVLLVGLTVQVGGLVLADRHPAAGGAVVIVAAVVPYLGMGLLIPRPPGGFIGLWQRDARARRAAQRANPTRSQSEFTLVQFAIMVACALPWQPVNIWLTGRDLTLWTHMLIVLAVIVTGSGVMIVTLELRRHHHRHASDDRDDRDDRFGLGQPGPGPSGFGRSASGPRLPGTVELHRRPTPEPGGERGTR